MVKPGLGAIRRGLVRAAGRKVVEMKTLRSRGFTLIELLVVIAIIAIMAAIVVPMAAAVNDRSRITECDAHLQQIGVALSMYFEDHGRYPASLQALYDERYLDQKELLRCSRGEHDYFYRPPGPNAGREDVVAACVDPATSAGARPHRHGSVDVVLQLNGKTRLDER
jgi:prepilin-type N-terminal cleavage/methylation domain-containing protein